MQCIIVQFARKQPWQENSKTKFAILVNAEEWQEFIDSPGLIELYRREATAEECKLKEKHDKENPDNNFLLAFETKTELKEQEGELWKEKPKNAVN